MFTFSRSDRVKSALDFLRVKREGIFTTCGKLKIAFLKGKRKRLGVVVGKCCGSAPERNRIKRVAREHFRLRRNTYPLGDVVVIALSGAQDKTNDELREAILKALADICRKAGKRDGCPCLKE